MFGFNDKVTLTGINTINQNGEIIDYIISFPITDYDFDIPEETIQISIFEGHLGRENYGYTAFKICVGEITSIEEICEKQNNNIKFLNKDIAKSIKNVDDKLCYYEDKDGKYIIFARIDDGDVYVKDIRELKKVLITISNNFENIQSAVTNIRKAKEQIDYSLTDEDQKITEKRREMCKKERSKSILEEIINHSNAIDEISMNYYYINWLKTFTDMYGDFCTNDEWLQDERVDEKDRNNAKKLDILYDIIDEYASEKRLVFTPNDNANELSVRYINSAFKIGFMVGQGGFFYCQRITPDEQMINFADIVNYAEKKQTKTRKKTI